MFSYFPFLKVFCVRKQPRKQHRPQALLSSFFVTAATMSLALPPIIVQDQSPFATRNPFQLRGKTTMFGNPIITCSMTLGIRTGSCNSAQTTTTTGTNKLLTNNADWIDYIDSDATAFTSSSAAYNFPADNPRFQIFWARLYWTRNTSTGRSIPSPASKTADHSALQNQLLLKTPGPSTKKTVAKNIFNQHFGYLSPYSLTPC
ncbi:hypothetical protein [Acaryochloris marina]|uniref:hypothetical protein n=1 Tax=Acaryochloris marina TaxID=155978 RepID=UPI001BB01C79|nr:hypothetical protein [Acaryochloris marina]QUY44063.1 hypothetical protein I1H34_08220 [Acaryochloris marina S15]